MDTVSLVGEKVTKPIGQIGTGDDDGRGTVLDLPNSPLNLAEICLQEELESIFSQENRHLAA